MPPNLRHKQSGFTLIQLSILLAIAGLVVASTLPGGTGGSDAEKIRITYERMRKIEVATQNFMAKNQRRPYPADITLLVSAAGYGVETVVNANYANGNTVANYAEIETIASTDTVIGSKVITVDDNLSNTIKKGWLVSIDGAGTGIPQDSWVVATEVTASPDNITLNKPANANNTNVTTYFRNPIVAGGVPTRTLGLPDEFALDGFGRRMVYMVDQRATVESRCANLQRENAQGAVAISAGANFTTAVKDRTMWALLSYGKDGQGAVSAQGAALNARIVTGNTADADTLTNAFFQAGTQTTRAITGNIEGLIQKEATATFDDLVWYDQTTKNTCSYGEESVNDSLEIDDIHTLGQLSFFAKGDFNGDKIDDLLIGSPSTEKIHIIFGKVGKGPLQDEVAGNETILSVNNLTTEQAGITITNDNTGVVGTGFGSSIDVGDINGDQCDDIIGYGTLQIVVVYGCSANFTSYTNLALTALGSNGFTLTTSSTDYVFSVGDVDNNGFDDILYSPLNVASTAGVNASYLYYGEASNASTTLNPLPTARGFSITGNASSPSCIRSTGTVDVSDVNDDGFDDMILTGCLNGATYDFYVIFGRLRTSFNTHVTAGTPDSLSLVMEISNSRAIAFNSTGSVYALKPHRSTDLNMDGVNDILLSDNRSILVIFGSSTLTGASFASPLTNASFSGTYGARFTFVDSGGTRPTNVPIEVIGNNGVHSYYLTGDFNSDNLTDLAAISKPAAPSTASGANAGSIYVALQPITPTYSSNMFLFATAAANPDGTLLNGFRIDGADTLSEISNIESLDLNDDGYNDIVVASSRKNAVDDDAYVVVIWGKKNTIARANPSNIDLSNLNFNYLP